LNVAERRWFVFFREISCNFVDRIAANCLRERSTKLHEISRKRMLVLVRVACKMITPNPVKTFLDLNVIGS
jgi:hypothetical protein